MTSLRVRAVRLLRRAAGAALVASAALAAPAGAADAIPGQVRIAVDCGSGVVAYSSGLGGSAAWVTTGGGMAGVLVPVAVAGTVTGEDGRVLRTFEQTRAGRFDGPTRTCSFTFSMPQDGGTTVITGSGRFAGTPRLAS